MVVLTPAGFGGSDLVKLVLNQYLLHAMKESLARSRAVKWQVLVEGGALKSQLPLYCQRALVWSCALPLASFPVPPRVSKNHLREGEGEGEGQHWRKCNDRGVRRCISAVPLPTTPRQGGSVQQDIHCPLPPAGAEVCYRRSTVHCPQVGGGALQALHCPLPPGSVAVFCMGSTAHCPEAVRRQAAGDPLPAATRHCGPEKRQFQRPLPEVVRRCAAGDPLSTAPRQSANVQ